MFLTVLTVTYWINTSPGAKAVASSKVNAIRSNAPAVPMARGALIALIEIFSAHQREYHV